MSWTRERLKTNGRIAFKKNYWSCVAVAVIMGIITGLSGVNGGRAGGSASQNSLYGTDGFGYLFAGLAITMAAIIVTLIILALEIFVGSLLEVGGKRFFVLNKTENQQSEPYLSIPFRTLCECCVGDVPEKSVYIFVDAAFRYSGNCKTL